MPLPVKIFPNKLAPNVPNNFPRNSSFCYLTSFWIVLLTPFNNKPESSRDLTIFIIPSTSPFDIITVVVPEPKIFLCIPASAADAAAVSYNGIKILLVMA